LGRVRLTGNESLGLLAAELDEPAIVLCNERGVFASWHRAILNQFGYDATEFTGRGMDLLDGRADPLFIERGLQEASNNGRFREVRCLKRKDGTRVQTEIETIALRNSAGELAGFGRVLRDVSLLRRAQEDATNLASAVNRSNILIGSLDGTIEHWTSGCERLYGWTADEAHGKKSHDLLKTKFTVPFEQIHRELLDKGTWHGELFQEHKDGRPLLISVDWVTLPRAEGDEPRVISTHTDITARLEMEQQLEAVNERYRQMAVELERSNEELEQFARIASHDLSAPLTTARWLTDLLATRHGRQLNPEGTHCLQQISASLERMSDLIEAVLAHALAGKSAISSLEGADADAALNAAIENLRRDIATSGATIKRSPLPKLRIQSQPLTQLFQNLLSNAIKYHRPGVTPHIEIVTAHQEDQCIVEVRDNGLGIEREWFERIFLPLQRRHATNVKGSGIGLATCKKIVSRAGGDIWVESELGSGSAFYFSLPASGDFESIVETEHGAN
jgi:PAS domain S-box-containing protein